MRARAHERWASAPNATTSAERHWLDAEDDETHAVVEAMLQVLRCHDTPDLGGLTFDDVYALRASYLCRPGAAVVTLGPSRPRRCAVCGMRAPEVSFRRRGSVLPAGLGNAGLLTNEECDSCRTAWQQADAKGLRSLSGTVSRSSPARRPGRAVAGAPAGAAREGAGATDSGWGHLATRAMGAYLVAPYLADEPAGAAALSALGRCVLLALPVQRRVEHDALRRWLRGEPVLLAQLDVFSVTTPWNEDTGIAVWELEVAHESLPSLVAMVWLGNCVMVWSARAATGGSLHVLWPPVWRPTVPPFLTRCRRVRSTPAGRVELTDVVVEAVAPSHTGRAWPAEVDVTFEVGGARVQVRTWVSAPSCDESAARYGYALSGGELIGALTVRVDGLRAEVHYVASPCDAEPRHALQTLSLLQCIVSGGEVRMVAADGLPVLQLPPCLAPCGADAPSLAASTELARSLVLINDQLGTHLMYPARPSAALLRLAASLAGALVRP